MPDSLLAPDALMRLVAPFADLRVGAVAGDFRYVAADGEGRGERTYWGHGPRLASAREPRRQRHVGHRTALRTAAGDLPTGPRRCDRRFLPVDRGDRRRAAFVVRAARGGVGSGRGRPGGGVPAQGTPDRPRLRERLAPPVLCSIRGARVSTPRSRHPQSAAPTGGAAARGARRRGANARRGPSVLSASGRSPSSCFTDSRSRDSRCGAAASRALPCSRFRSHSMRGQSRRAGRTRAIPEGREPAALGARPTRGAPAQHRDVLDVAGERVIEGIVIFAGLFAGLAWVAYRPEWGAPYFAALIYLRLSDTLHIDYGLPSLFMFVAPAMLLLAVGRWLVTGARAGRGWQSAAFLLVLYGAICSGSLLYAVNQERTTEALMNYVDGIFIVLVLTLYLRNQRDFARTLTALLLGGILLATLTVFQQVTGSYDHTFVGLARANDTQHLRRDRRLPQRRACISQLLRAGSHHRGSAGRRLAPVAPAPTREAVGRRLGPWPASSPRSSTPTHAAASWHSRPLRCRWRPGFRGRSGCGGRWPRAGPPSSGPALVAPTDYGQRLPALGQVADVVHGDAPSESALRGRLSEVTSAALMFVDHPLSVSATGTSRSTTIVTREGSRSMGAARNARRTASTWKSPPRTAVLGLWVRRRCSAYPIAGPPAHSRVAAAPRAAARRAARSRVRDLAVRLPDGFAVPASQLSALFLAAAHRPARRRGAPRRETPERVQVAT